jgi:hypothetical protein
MLGKFCASDVVHVGDNSWFMIIVFWIAVNADPAHQVALTVMMIATSTNVLKRLADEMKKGNGWKWNASG